ncbi:hypothetical protein HY632_00870 [Candidatus Uhrbacteria bacterium]|nr:hypothetical protein [Candidatus Uhrbacteria bacterium]
MIAFLHPITWQRIALLGSAALSIANATWWHAPWIGIPMTVVLLIAAAHTLRGTDALAVGSLRLASIAATGTGALVLLGWYTLPVRLLLLAGIGGIAVAGFGRLTFLPLRRLERPHVLAVLTFVAFGSATALLLAVTGTTAAIRSPWDAAPMLIAVLIGSIAASAAACASVPTRICIVPYGVALTLALGSSIALASYRIGFGFDHFLHAAAEQIIAHTGSLSPRPLFYGGHYGLVVLLADATTLPIALMDRLLVPLLVIAVLVPIATLSLRAILPPRAAAFALLALPLLPFLPFLISTPQALANVFACSTVFLLLVPTHTRSAVLATGAALVSQPLTGILLSGIMVGHLLRRHGHRVAAAWCTLGSAVAIPVAFLIAPLFLPALDIRIAPAASAATALATHLRAIVQYTTNDRSFADALTLAHRVLPLLWIGYAIIGACTLGRTARTTMHAAIAALGASALVYATITIPTQLPEEHIQFPLRILAIAVLLATPLAAAGLGVIGERLRTRTARIAGSMIIGTAVTATLLLAYPRNDAQTRSGLWSVSASDIAAVHAITADAGTTPYVVVGNQMLGAAAIRELGFQPHHRAVDGTEVLAFPLPAGGPIANTFWEFVDTNPNRTVVDHAMTYAGVPRAYLVLHAYWRNYATLTARAQDIADAELAAPPHLRIFRFDRPSGGR